MALLNFYCAFFYFSVHTPQGGQNFINIRRLKENGFATKVLFKFVTFFNYKFPFFNSSTA